MHVIYDYNNVWYQQFGKVRTIAFRDAKLRPLWLWQKCATTACWLDLLAKCRSTERSECVFIKDWAAKAVCLVVCKDDFNQNKCKMTAKSFLFLLRKLASQILREGVIKRFRHPRKGDHSIPSRFIGREYSRAFLHSNLYSISTAFEICDQQKQFSFLWNCLRNWTRFGASPGNPARTYQVKGLS